MILLFQFRLAFLLLKKKSIIALIEPSSFSACFFSSASNLSNPSSRPQTLDQPRATTLISLYIQPLIPLLRSFIPALPLALYLTASPVPVRAIHGSKYKPVWTVVKNCWPDSACVWTNGLLELSFRELKYKAIIELSLMAGLVM